MLPVLFAIFYRGRFGSERETHSWRKRQSPFNFLPSLSTLLPPLSAIFRLFCARTSVPACLSSTNEHHRFSPLADTIETFQAGEGNRRNFPAALKRPFVQQANTRNGNTFYAQYRVQANGVTAIATSPGERTGSSKHCSCWLSLRQCNLRRWQRTAKRSLTTQFRSRAVLIANAGQVDLEIFETFRHEFLA